MSENPSPPAFDEGVAYATELRTPKSQGLAIAGLVLGIMSIPALITVFGGIPLAVVGVILCSVALVNIRRDPERFGGKGLAIGGLACGLVGLLLSAAAIVGIYWFAMTARQNVMASFRSVTMNSANARLNGYAASNNGQYPPDLDSLVSSSGEVFWAPTGGGTNNVSDFSYVVGLTTSDPGDWILLFSDPTLDPDNGACILRLDGTSEYLTEPELSAEIDAFRQKYRDDRGQDPEIIPPH